MSLNLTTNLDDPTTNPTLTNATARPLLIFGLNPAFQTTLQFNHFVPGSVNRAFRKAHSIGGKGQNCAIACLGYHPDQVGQISIFQCLGGHTGKYVSAFLDDLNIHQITLPVNSDTRVCTTLLDRHTGEMTELIEPSGAISVNERKQLLQLAIDVIQNSPNLRAIAFCGSLPSGLDGAFLADVCTSAPSSMFVYVDVVEIECVAQGKVDMLKINVSEAVKISQCWIRPISESGQESPLDIGKLLLWYFKDLPILALTNGPEESLLFERNSDGTASLTTYRIPPITKYIHGGPLKSSISNTSLDSLCRSLPKATLDPNQQVDKPAASSSTASSSDHRQPALEINPLGAGDTCSGVFLCKYLECNDARESFRYGLAAASASCLIIDQSSVYDGDTMLKIAQDIEFTTRTGLALSPVN